MASNWPTLFSPDPSKAGEYVKVVLARLNDFQKTLRERQSQLLNKVPWGQPVMPGRHARFTIDRKHRGIHNPYDTDPNALTSDDEAETKDGAPQTDEEATSANTDSDVVIPFELFSSSDEVSEIAPPAGEQPNVPVHTEEHLKPVPSEGSMHSNQDDPHRSPAKRQRLCKKLGNNKENHKVKVHCLQRRSLFRKAQQEASGSPVHPSVPEAHDLKTKQIPASLSKNPLLDTDSLRKSVYDVSPVLPSRHETLDPLTDQMQESLSNVPNGMTTSLDTNTLQLQEEDPIPWNNVPIVARITPTKDSPLKSPSPPRTLNGKNEKASPLRESNPSSNSCEVRSSSPVFSAYESPFRHSEFLSRLRDNSASKSDGSAIASGGGSFVTNPEDTSTDLHSKLFSILSESEGEDFIDNHQRQTRTLRKTVISRKLPKQKPLVQCPLCCEWFKPKIIETHAANCGINTPMQPDEHQNLVDLTSNLNETRDSNRLSESQGSNPGPQRNTDTTLDESVEPAAVVPNVECCLIPISSNNSKEPTQSTQRISSSFDLFEPIREEEESLTDFENLMIDSIIEQQQQQTETLHVPPEIQMQASGSNSVLKRCFICDLSYVDGKPFSSHLRSCRKKYQKLRRQFSEENEGPQRKTRTRSTLATNTYTGGGDSEEF